MSLPKTDRVNFDGVATWIPSGVGESNGWVTRRKIEYNGILCIVYDVYDNWHPRESGWSFRQSSGPLGIDWDEQPLGAVTDKVIADDLGVSTSAVKKARKKRGIKGTRPAREKLEIDWERQPLGKRFDADIAQELGVDAKTVRVARKKLGIPRKYIDWNDQPLGKVSDAQLAKDLGVDPSSVGKARRTRGIAAKTPYRRVDWSKEPLGQISDSDIARALGVSQPRVTRARRKLGIPAFVGGKFRGR